MADSDLVTLHREIGNGLEVRCKLAGEPHQLGIALRLVFKTPA